MTSADLQRRVFLKAGGFVAGGVLLPFSGAALASAGAAEGGQVTGWLHIAADSAVTLFTDKTEMGQGAHTTMAMLVAEELEVPWSWIHVETAPSLPAYDPTGRGQNTGGSNSVRQGFDVVRQIGAVAREMLKQAAAERWGVAVEACSAEAGFVVHSALELRASYGELAAAAQRVTLSKSAPLKTRAAWAVIGTSPPRTDTPGKVDGSAVFGIDVRLPGLLTAAILQCPVFGGTLATVDPKPALRLRGVTHVVPLANAVVVVAKGYWPACLGLRALLPQWNVDAPQRVDDASIGVTLDAGLASEGVTGVAKGDALQALAQAAKTLDASYEVPFLAHATMEPMNATAWVRKGRAELWAPTQRQTYVQDQVAAALNLKRADILVHTPFLGGGFGRRLKADYAVQAALVSKAVNRPVKLIWSREEDIQHDFYRPRTKVKMRAGLDSQGHITAIDAVMAEDSHLAESFPPTSPSLGKLAAAGMDGVSYGVAHVRFRHVHSPMSIPIGAWRSVSTSQSVFFGECMVDELAHLAGVDPLVFRLRQAVDPRHRAVLEVVRDLSRWGTPLPPGHGRGVALLERYGTSVAAEVVEVEVVDGIALRVARISCAVDCGFAVNPRGAHAQAEGAILYGLDAALFGEITLKEGCVQQSNFSDYRVLSLAETPPIDIQFVESPMPPSGMGEPTLPPVAPALVNAIFAATGRRLRSLPLKNHGFTII